MKKRTPTPTKSLKRYPASEEDEDDEEVKEQEQMSTMADNASGSKNERAGSSIKETLLL